MSQPPDRPAPGIDATEALPARAPTAPAAPDARGSAPMLHFPASAHDRYREGEEVGRGAIGRVLLAEDRVLRRQVAVKVLFSPRGRAALRFAREVLLTARLEHPSIVPVHDAGSGPDGAPFYVMKLVRGRTLASAMSACESRAARLGLLPHVLAVVNAVAFAHSEGIIHRDLKPANVLIGPFGETSVIDWGLAKDLAHGDAELADEALAGEGHVEGTVRGALVGTPAYMAPEQARGGTADFRSDVYALGVILYRVLSGRAPFEGTTSALELLDRLRNETPPPLSTIEPKLPSDLLALVGKAMARAPDDRYPSARELAADLEAYLNGQLVSAHQYSRWMLARRFLRKHRTAVQVALVGLALLAALGVWFVVSVVRERDVARRERTTALEAQARAEQAENDVRGRLAEIYAEQGRQALGQDELERALVYLSEAYALGRRDTSLRFLLARAAVALDTRAAPNLGHSEAVNAVAFSPDGSMAVSASADGTARIWDAETGAVRHALAGGNGRLMDAVFSPDGARVALAGVGGARVFDASSGALLFTLAGHDNMVYSVRYAPDGARLVTAGADGTVRFWGAADGAPGPVIAAHQGQAYLATFDARGKTVLSVSEDRTGAVWDVAEGRTDLVRRLGPDGHEVLAGALSPDGTLASTCGIDPHLSVWKTRSDAAPKVFAGLTDWTFKCPFSPDGRKLAAATAEGLGLLWDLASGERTALRGHAGYVLDIVFSPDGARLATASKDESARVWDAKSGLTVSTLLGHRGWVNAVRFSPDGARVLTGSADATARVWDVESGRLLRALDGRRASSDESPWHVATLAGHRDTVYGLGIDPRGERVVTASYDGTARIFDRATGALERELVGHEGNVVNALFGLDGRVVVTAGSTDRTIRIWDAESGAARAVLRGHTGDIVGMEGDAAGTLVASAAGDGTARVWSLADAKEVAVLRGHEGRAQSASFALDGGRVVTAGNDRTARIWELPSGRLVHTLRGHGSPLWYAGFDRTGARVCTTSTDETAALWDSATGELLLRLRGHTATVSFCRFSPDGALVATSAEDRSARVWNAATGALLYTLREDDAVNDVLFTADGALLVTAGQNGLARVWDARSGKLLATYRGHRDWLYGPAITRDGRFLVTASADHSARVWDLGLEERDPAWLAAQVRCRVPLRLEGALAVPVSELPACP